LAWISEDELLTGFTESIHTGHILVWNTQTWTPRKLAEGLYPTWSSEAKQIAYYRHSMCLSNRACFTKRPDTDTFRPFSSRFDIFTIDPGGQKETLILNTFGLPDQFICPASFGFAWSPDGQYLAFTEACKESDPGDLYILRVADGHVERIIEDMGMFSHVLSWIEAPPKQ
jgi:Tol biopolymer transport system component